MCYYLTHLFVLLIVISVFIAKPVSVPVGAFYKASWFYTIEYNTNIFQIFYLIFLIKQFDDTRGRVPMLQNKQNKVAIVAENKRITYRFYRCGIKNYEIKYLFEITKKFFYFFLVENNFVDFVK